MGYTIQAIIGKRAEIRSAEIKAGNVILLPQDLGMIPLGDECRERNAIPFLPLTDEGWKTVPESIAKLCSSLSSKGKIAYIEAEFFGGEGTQASALWEDGKMIRVPMISGDAINSALEFLGVSPRENMDHFDTVGLGDHRNTDDWLSE